MMKGPFPERTVWETIPTFIMRGQPSKFEASCFGLNYSRTEVAAKARQWPMKL